MPITIKSGCWLCARSTIIAGSVIGNRSIVAAGAVVKGDFPSDSIIGGIPGKIIKKTGE